MGFLSLWDFFIVQELRQGFTERVPLCASSLDYKEFCSGSVKGFLYGIYKGVMSCHLGLGRSMALLTLSALGLLLAPGFRGLAVVSVVFEISASSSVSWPSKQPTKLPSE